MSTRLPFLYFNCSIQRQRVFFCSQVSHFLPVAMAWATAGFIFAIVLFSDATLSWVNNYDQSLHFECPAGEHLNRLESQHSNRHEDRVWNFGCKNGFVSEKCHWSDHETSYDKPMNFTCQDGGLVAGLSSRHSNDQEDRVWRFKCCSVSYYAIAF